MGAYVAAHNIFGAMQYGQWLSSALLPRSLAVP
jgi:hypothetical protein